jgi:hypothetical protein
MDQHDGTVRKMIEQLNREDLMGNGLYQNPDDNTLRKRADIYLWDVIMPRLTAPPL